MSSVQIQLPALEEVCRQNRVRRLSFFGSVLRPDFNASSDVDILVEFEDEARVGLIGLSRLQLELEALLGRPVDIHTVAGLNPLFKAEVLRSAEVQYEQKG